MNVFYPTDVSRLSVNLRFPSLLLFLLQIEACWRRSVKGAVHRVLHKHQAKQEKSRSGQVTWTHHWSGSSLDPLDSSRVQDTQRQIYLFIFVLFLQLFQKLWLRSRPAGQHVKHQVATFPHNQLELLPPCCGAETHESNMTCFSTVLLKWYMCVTSGSDGPQTGSQKHVGLSLN